MENENQYICPIMQNIMIAIGAQWYSKILRFNNRRNKIG